MSPPVHNNYGPRAGFAWQPLHNTVVRGGIGLYWDTLSARSQYAQNDIEGQGWPWRRGFTATAPNSALGPNNNNILPASFTPITTLAGGTKMNLPANPRDTPVKTNQPLFQNPVANQYNFNLQIELSQNTEVSVRHQRSRYGNLTNLAASN